MLRSAATATRSIRRKSTLVASIVPSSLKENAHRIAVPLPSPQNNTADLIKQVLGDQAWKKNRFYDPDNILLDLNKANKILWQEIYDGARSRQKVRFQNPSNKWISINGGAKLVALNLKKIEDEFTNATIHPSLLDLPLAIGDVVTLAPDLTNLYLVVATPSTLASATYQFVDKKGEIKFGGVVYMRCPGVVPELLHPFIKLFVQLETKTKDVAPVGIADDKFSKLTQALPAELRSTYTEAPSQLGLFDLSDFVVAQAASQLLTNTNVNTFIVPNAARDVFSAPLTNLAIATLDLIDVFASKLEVVHRMLQYDDYGQVANTPRVVLVWELLYMVRGVDTGIDLIKLRQKGGNAHLGYSSNPTHWDKQCLASEYMALVLALWTQPRLWVINSLGKYALSSVQVMPIQKLQTTETVIDYLKQYGPTKFANWCQQKSVGGSNPPPPFAAEIINLLKDYISGNISSDPVLETSLVNVIRAVDPSPNPEYTYDYSKARAYQLLQDLGEQFVNPVIWNLGLALPGYGATHFADYQNQYYEALEQGLTNDDFYDYDPLKKLRTEYCEPVFCIDSPDAHEIDDGIGIKVSGDKYTVSVHVANPTSYIKPDSVLSSIALDRGTTVYLPEGPLRMLPEAISEMAGLGKSTARTFAIEWDMDRKMMDEYFEANIDPNYLPKKSLLQTIYAQMKKSCRYVAYTASDFPQGYTYERVNDVLSTGHDTHYVPLKRLHGIAMFLQLIKLELGNSVEMGNQVQMPLKVESIDGGKESWFKNNGSQYQLYHQGKLLLVGLPDAAVTDTLPSQTLVSLCMVFANHLSTICAQENDIDLLYRTQKMKLDENVKKELDQMLMNNYRKNTVVSIAERLQLIRILNSLRYLTIPDIHQLLGLSSYATVTSPLRRYVDMINQWQFQHKLLGEPGVLPLEVAAQQLLARELINNHGLTVSDRFWQGMFIKQYLNLKNQGKICDRYAIRWKVLVKANANVGNMLPVEVLGFNLLNAKIEINDSNREKLTSLAVGDVFEDNGHLSLEVVDPIENELRFVYR